ncbi:MAG: GldG family protein [Kiritimatiellae bacterium]|nr:GldG family protein [Kiritimatiellia bacterium]MDD4735131.1 GldG family protein [Kiritimatiellia bacterium]
MKNQDKRNPYMAETHRRRWALGLNAGGAVMLSLVLLVMVNYLSFRHYRRWDVSQNRFYALSEKTIQLLNTVSNPLSVTVFFQSNQDVYQDLKNLLQEYEYVCPQMRVEWVDPDRDLARTEELATRYGVEESNVVVFEHDGRSSFVTSEEIARYDYAPLQSGQPPVQTAFSGESAFSSAIQAVTIAKKPVVYFLQGHGEGNPTDPDKRRGFSKIAAEMERDTIEVKLLRLGNDLGIPKDCNALVVAGPEKDYSITEIDLLAAYLENNGRMMILLDAGKDSGLDLLLEDWDIEVGNNLVVDPSKTLTGRGDLFVTSYFTHPITENMEQITSVFYLPRSMRPLAYEGGDDPADRPHVSVLAASSANGWGETNLEDPHAHFDVEEDLVGPIPIALAVEKGPVPGIDVKIKPTRLVVIGDSDFVANKGVIGGNIQFFMNALNWLLERDDQIGIAPKPVLRSKLLVTRTQKTAIFWLTAGVMPGTVALLGLLVWLRRRR